VKVINVSPPGLGVGDGAPSCARTIPLCPETRGSALWPSLSASSSGAATSSPVRRRLYGPGPETLLTWMV